MFNHPRRRLALALTVGALLTLGAGDPAGAGAAKPPSFLLDGGDTTYSHPPAW